MDKQSEALLLAEMHEDHEFPYRTAKELRRLHQVNQELVEALSLMCDTFLDTEGSHGQCERNAIDKAQAILAKHRGQA